MSTPWEATLSALLTPVIAILGIYIAWQQWRTNREKLKLELFDRRYVVYKAAIDLINSILQSGKADEKAVWEFVSKTRSAAFTVGTPIETFLNEELYKRVIDLQTLESERSALRDEALRINVRRQSEIKTWLHNQYSHINRLFRDQLTLKH